MKWMNEWNDSEKDIDICTLYNNKEVKSKCCIFSHPKEMINP